MKSRMRGITSSMLAGTGAPTSPTNAPQTTNAPEASTPAPEPKRPDVANVAQDGASGDPPASAATVDTAPIKIPPSALDKSILIIGDPGAGKTQFIGTCPRPIKLFDFDKGWATLENDIEGISVSIFKDAPLGTRPLPKYGIYEYGTAWDEFQKTLNAIGTQIDEGTCPYKTIAIDSFTMFQSCILAHILSHSKHPKGPLEIQDYGSLLNIQKSFFDQFSSWPLLKICTAHVERTKNELNEGIEMLPLGLGKFTALMPMYFDEIYYLEVMTGNAAQRAAARKEGKTLDSVRVLTTQPTNYIKQARTRKNVPSGIVADFKLIEPYLRPKNVG